MYLFPSEKPNEPRILVAEASGPVSVNADEPLQESQEIQVDTLQPPEPVTEAEEENDIQQDVVSGNPVLESLR